MSFDKATGKIGGCNPTRPRHNEKAETALEKIHAVQLIDKLARLSSRRSGTRYVMGFEVNVVFKNGARSNVIDCDSLSRALKSAELLSEFLGRPLWLSTLPPRGSEQDAKLNEKSKNEKRLVSRTEE
jgi:hypothetical protein